MMKEFAVGEDNNIVIPMDYTWKTYSIILDDAW
jgi:hypothetical protein